MIDIKSNSISGVETFSDFVLNLKTKSPNQQGMSSTGSCLFVISLTLDFPTELQPLEQFNCPVLSKEFFNQAITC